MSVTRARRRSPLRQTKASLVRAYLALQAVRRVKVGLLAADAIVRITSSVMEDPIAKAAVEEWQVETSGGGEN